MKLRILGAALTLAVLSASTHAQGQLWLVDDDGGAGVDFVDIQSAVNAAASGDTIRVRPGQYNKVQIRDKSLTILGANPTPATRPRISRIEITRISASQRVLLRRLQSTPFKGSIHISQCQGSIVVEDCLIDQSESSYSDRNRVDDSLAVVFIRCELVGPDSIGSFDPMVPPRTGLVCTSSYVHLFDCTVTGGEGWSTDPLLGTFPACSGAGGPGIHQEGGLLYLSGCAVSAGPWGIWPSPCSVFSYPFVDGEPGLQIEGATSLAFQLDTTITGGIGVVPGPDVAGLIGALAAFPGEARSFEWDPWVPALGSLSASYTGVAGDAVYLVVSLNPAPYFLPTCHGTLMFDSGLQILPAGWVPSGGVLTQTAPAPGLAPSLGALPIHGQAAFFDTAGQCYLGSPSVMTLHH